MVLTVTSALKIRYVKTRTWYMSVTVPHDVTTSTHTYFVYSDQRILFPIAWRYGVPNNRIKWNPYQCELDAEYLDLGSYIGIGLVMALRWGELLLIDLETPGGRPLKDRIDWWYLLCAHFSSPFVYFFSIFFTLKLFQKNDVRAEINADV